MPRLHEPDRLEKEKVQFISFAIRNDNKTRAIINSRLLDGLMNFTKT